MDKKEDRVKNSPDTHENQFRDKQINNYTYDMRKHKELTKQEIGLIYKLGWTLIWFTFLGFVSVWFNTMTVLWLLILWFLGLFI